MKTEPPVVKEKKALKGGGLKILLILLTLTAMGLGILGVITNTKLNSTMESQIVLQNQLDNLSLKNETITSDLDTAKADLEKAKTNLEKVKKDLLSTEASLTRVNGDATKLQADIDKALTLVDLLSGTIIEKVPPAELQNRVEATNDLTLKEKYERFSTTGSQTDFEDWLEYIFKTLSALLKT